MCGHVFSFLLGIRFLACICKCMVNLIKNWQTFSGWLYHFILLPSTVRVAVITLCNVTRSWFGHFLKAILLCSDSSLWFEFTFFWWLMMLCIFSCVFFFFAIHLSSMLICLLKFFIHFLNECIYWYVRKMLVSCKFKECRKVLIGK